MGLIDRLGGYEKAKSALKYRISQNILRSYIGALSSALLEYRRGHNIFEVGDMVVLDGNAMGSEVQVVLPRDVGAWYMKFWRHAMSKEIEQGFRDD